MYFMYDQQLADAGSHPIDFLGFDWTEESIQMFADAHKSIIYFEADLVTPDKPGRNEFEIVMSSRSTNVMVAYVNDDQVLSVRAKNEKSLQYLAESFPKHIYFVEGN